VSDLLFIHSPEACEHLVREGRAPEKIHDVGNVMVDALDLHLSSARARQVAVLDGERLRHGQYALVTLHRPSNVDDPAALGSLLEILTETANRMSVIFPVHPRTRARLDGVALPRRIALTPPKGYLDFLALLDAARCVLTDSDGIQEKTTALGVPCLTLRENTERPITCQIGSNTLVGRDLAKVRRALCRILDDDHPKGRRPPRWDGHAGERIVETWATMK
jgi:UDP-N-acetylglucosamine 2-epimerase (non-hydrolysing)